MEDPDLPLVSAPRRCPIDQRLFHPKRRHQLYCGRRCRKAAARLREAGVSKQAFVRRALSLPALLGQAGEQRSLAGLPELQAAPYLAAQAAVIEAHMQATMWQQRLAERRQVLAACPDPGFRWRRLIVRPGDPLAVPDAYTHLGAASTEESLAVVVVGRSERDAL